MGEATLLCITPDVSLNDALTVRWYVHDTMTLLYTYPVSEINNIFLTADASVAIILDKFYSFKTQ